jgi:hypothetical protein
VNVLSDFKTPFTHISGNLFMGGTPAGNPGSTAQFTFIVNLYPWEQDQSPQTRSRWCASFTVLRRFAIRRLRLGCSDSRRT